MADINSYALGLEFQLQIQPAMDALSTMAKAVQSLKDVMKEAASVFVGPEIKQAKQENMALSEAKAELGEMVGKLERVTLQYKNAVDQTGFATLATERSTKEHTETLGELERTYQKTHERLTKFLKEHKELAKEFKGETKLLEKLETGFDKSKRSLAKTTDNINAQKQAWNKVATEIASFGKEAGQAHSIIAAGLGRYGAMGAALLFLWQGFRDVASMQDAYSKASTRLLGTQKDLIISTNRLRMTTGASSEEAVAAMKALAQAGFSARDEIDKLAEVNYKFYTITGVSNQTTADYQKRIVQLTGSADAATKGLTKMANAIRNSGLSAQEAEGLINQLNKSVMAASFVYGRKAVEGLHEEMLAMSGAAKKVGADFGALQSHFDPMMRDPIKAQVAFGRLGLAYDENASHVDNLRRYMNKAADEFANWEKMSMMERKALAIRLGLTDDAAAAMAHMTLEAKKSNKTMSEWYGSIKEGPKLEDQFAEATATLTQQLKMLLGPILATASSIMSVLVPALTTVLEPISKVVKWLTGLISKIQAIPGVGTGFNAVVGTLLVVAALKASGAIGLLTGGFKALADTVKGGIAIGKKVISWITGTGDAAKSASKNLNKMTESTKQNTVAMQASQKTSPTAGSSIKMFLINLAQGLKAMGAPGVLKGVLVLGLLAVLVGGTMLLVAIAMKKLGLSIADLVGAAVGLFIASVAFFILAKAIIVLAGAGMIAAKPLAILALVFLAIGVAILLAGVGLMLAAKAFTELFKVVLAKGWTFLAIVGAMAVLFPILALGLQLFAMSMIIAAPIILAGFVMLLAAAVMGMIINPVFREFADTLSSVANSIAAMGPGAGAALVSLAVGITAFMAALMGIAAAGAGGKVASFFTAGAMKSPQKQAEEIASAIATIAGPANTLAGALDKLGNIKDVFKPFIDSVLGRKEEIQEAALVIEDLAKRMDAARRAMEGEPLFKFPFDFGLRAEPVRKPLITEDTARKIREERNQSQMVEGTKGMKSSLDKIGAKIGEAGNVKELTDLLKVWLPRIARPDEEAGGLASAVNQWS